MSRSAEKLFTKALHLSDPWEVFSVNIDDPRPEWVHAIHKNEILESI